MIKKLKLIDEKLIDDPWRKTQHSSCAWCETDVEMKSITWWK